MTLKRRFAGAALVALALPLTAQAATFAPYKTSAPAMLGGLNGFQTSALFTVGETLPNGFQPVGVLDGIGAWRLNSTTVRVAINHELGSTSAKPYSVVDGIGGITQLTGARMSLFDIDVASRGIVNAGQAYDRIYDRAGDIVSNADQLGGGLSRLCSGAAFEANTYGAGKGLVDRIYFGGEETGNGTMYALDTATNALHAAPALGRGAWENATQINTGTADKVAFILSDDSSGSSSDPGTPMYLYVGDKNAKGDNSFLDRNGLAEGKMYVWKSNSGDANPAQFNGQDSQRDGQWVEINNYDPAMAGKPGYDDLGYADQETLRSEAAAVGAFRFSRPEDVATNPANDQLVALASTGSSRFGGADTWGTVYTIETKFDADGKPAGAQIKIIYDGNDDPTNALRSPDNLTWSGPDELLVQEDQATNWANGNNPNEASIVSLTLDGKTTAVARIDRLATNGQVDTNAGSLGAWESSGILDVSALFGLAAGELFLTNVQAHGISTPALGTGGQLLFLQRGQNAAVPEPGTWVMLLGGFGLVAGIVRRRRQPHTRLA